MFVIDPKKIIRLTISYPAAVGRSFDEVVRVIDSLQAGDKYKIATPVNWQPGQDVIVNAAVSNDDARKLFPNYKTVLVSKWSLIASQVAEAHPAILYSSRT